MILHEWQQQVMDESVELKKKIVKLTQFLYETTTALETTEYNLLKYQLQIMMEYSETLDKRMANFI